MSVTNKCNLNISFDFDLDDLIECPINTDNNFADNSESNESLIKCVEKCDVQNEQTNANRSEYETFKVSLDVNLTMVDTSLSGIHSTYPTIFD